MPSATTPSRHGGKQKEVSADERAVIVAAYHKYGNIEKMKPHVGGFGETVIRRILKEEGVPRTRAVKMPVDRARELRAAMSPLWEAGIGYKEIRDRLGIGLENATIRNLMTGVPRRPRTSNWRLREATALHDDDDIWTWVAGVIDARGVIYRGGHGHPDTFTIGVNTGRDRELAEAICAAVGAGSVSQRSNHGFDVCRWDVIRRSDVKNVLVKIEPFLRVKQGMARVVIASIEAIERKGG
jgi:hypothetical protein